jgi:hypothetical protein
MLDTEKSNTGDREIRQYRERNQTAEIEKPNTRHREIKF